MPGDLSLVFPIAGQGARFGYRFKPFLNVRGTPFICAAFAPFRAWLGRIGHIRFICTQEQESSHQVSRRLGQLFPSLPITTTILDAPTSGPAMTLQQALVKQPIRGAAIICDCDHAVEVDAFMRATADPAIACAVPTWPLDGQSVKSWSVAGLDASGRLLEIREKALPSSGETVRGVIGCYYFTDIGTVASIIAEHRMTYLSEVVARLIAAGSKVISVPVERAEFFGDPARLAFSEGRGA
jgi:GTP:adenosylcobinamide-phosphate guanylyltransferase